MRSALLAVVSIAVALAISELGLRYAGSRVLASRYWTESNHPYQPGDVDIVCIGESTTAGLWVDPSDSYPKKLEGKLRERLGTDRIRTIVPPHVGQNSSQQANRIADYLDLYRPRLLILMAGANNEWSLAESHVTRFVSLDSLKSIKLRLTIFANSFRVFKLVRRGYLTFSNQWERNMNPGQNSLALWGDPEYTGWPPEGDVFGFARKHREAFRALWKYDMKLMIDEARQRSVPVLLMTYPVMPKYLTPEDFQQLASETGVPPVDNHASFDALRASGTFEEYVFPQDHWHPNAKGYEIVAESAANTILALDLLHASASVDSGSASGHQDR